VRIKILALFSTALLWSGTQAIAAPGDDIGSAVRIVNLVTAEYETDARRLATGDNVRQDELIEVSTDGTGELKLRDETKLALGPGSRLVLDEFVYNPDIAGGAIVLNLVKGTFRFITGIAAKPAYVIRTPTASITVRGTIFDVFVQKSGAAWLLLIEGAIEVCNVWGECLLHDEPGKIIPITADGDVGNPVNWSSLPETPPFESAFPFVVGPPAIDIDTIFTPDDIINANFPEGPGTQIQDDPPTGGEQATGDDYYPPTGGEQATGDDYYPPTGGSGPTGGEQATGDDYYPPTGDDYYPLPPIVAGPTVVVHGGWIDVPRGCKRRKRCDRWNRGIGAKRADRAARRAANRARNANRRRNAKRANRANRAARANRRAAKRANRANRRAVNRADRVNRRAANRARKANRARNVNRRRNANRGRNVNRRRNANRARNVNRRRNANRARNVNRRRNANRGRNVNRRRNANRGRNVNRRRAGNRGRRGGGRRGGRRRRR